jgi:hypothetical protein
MANGLLDLLGGLGTTPPAYMEGLLGAQATEDLRKRSIGTGLANALVGYLAMPKNQNLGLGRILAGTAQAGLQGAQGVYDTATQDYMQAQKIAEMQRAKEQQIAQQEAINLVAQNNPQLGQVLKAYPQAAAGVLEKIYTPKEAKPRETAIAPNGQLIYKDTGDLVTQTSFAAPVKPNEPPSSIQEYEYAKKQGYGGSFKQFQEELKKAGATSINMPSESERTSGFLTSRLQNALGQINKVVTNNPSAASPKIGAEAVQLFTESDYLKNLVNPASRQQVENAQLELLDSALTLGTGAAYTREQLQNYSKSYFPQLGDKPSTVKDKQDRLKALLNAAKIKAGRAAPEDVGLPANVTVERVK